MLLVKIQSPGPEFQSSHKCLSLAASNQTLPKRNLGNVVLSFTPVEKAMATHSSTLAWKIPWIEEPGRLQSMGSPRLDMTEWLHFLFSLPCIGEGNGNPLQYSCLENPRDRGAWWAAIYRVAQSQTWLMRLSSSSSFTPELSTQFLCHLVCEVFADTVDWESFYSP